MKTTTLFWTLLLVLLAAADFCHPMMAQEDTCVVNVVRTYINGRQIPWDSVQVRVNLYNPIFFTMRSEERRVGKEGS